MIEQIKIWISKFTLWRLKRVAMRMHGIDGKQYHIIPISGNKLLVINNTMINAMNKRRKKSEQIRMREIYEKSLFSTPVVSPFKR